jgi:hypothetical protein
MVVLLTLYQCVVRSKLRTMPVAQYSSRDDGAVDLFNFFFVLCLRVFVCSFVAKKNC